MKSFFKGVTSAILLSLPLVLVAGAHAAYDSGSICANPANPACRGAYNPQVNDVIQLPPDGILDYTSFTVPFGVTVSFQKNAKNTPVIIRTSGNVDIQGTVDVSGTAATCSGTACGGNLGDDGQPGVGGPGGFDGGFGGSSPVFGGVNGQLGGSGKGPGGGLSSGGSYLHAGGGGFGSTGGIYADFYSNYFGSPGGSAYGQQNLLPLIGGSGGGGGAAGLNFNGGGGGGGGGAILISASGTISVGYYANQSGGRIFADGGAGGQTGGDGAGASGGGGSGGAIKLVADTIRYASSDRDILFARGGGGTCGVSWGMNCNSGSPGRIRLEANNMQWSGSTQPGYTFGAPGKLFVPNNPTLTIITVASVAAPALPSGNADITLPTGTTSATVTLAATNVPKGTTVTVYVVPTIGASRSAVISSALDGVDDSATTATASIPLSPGNNVVSAAVTFTATTQLQASLPTFGGEKVARIRVESIMGGESKTTYITDSGKEYPANKAKG